MLCTNRSCPMGWLRLVGSLKVQVSFAKEPYKRAYILQKRPKFLRSLLIVATPYTNEGSGFSRTTDAPPVPGGKIIEEILLRGPLGCACAHTLSPLTCNVFCMTCCQLNLKFCTGVSVETPCECEGNRMRAGRAP